MRDTPITSTHTHTHVQSHVRQTHPPTYPCTQVIETKFLMPKDPDLNAKYMALCDEVKMAFQNFTDAL